MYNVYILLFPVYGDPVRGITLKNMDQCCAGGEAKKCGCPHHKMVPLLITLLGLAFLLKAMGILSAGFVGYTWPVLIILIGLQKMMSGMCKCCGGKSS